MENQNFFNARRIALILIILGLLGLADASYLTVMSLNELPLPCTVFEGCNTVAASPYSKVFGVPLSLFGAIFYLLVSCAGIFYLLREKMMAVKILVSLASIGFLLSIYFTYLQGFVIKAFCIYCIASATISTLIFIFALSLRHITKPVQS